MPATDWNEITFSRSYLRPNDGLDPDVRQLRREAVQLAKRKQIPAYEKARDLLKEAEKKEKVMKDRIRKDELVRQSKERENLAEAFKMRKASFDEEWEHKRREMEREVAEKRQGFEDRVEGQRNALELAIDKKAKVNMKLYNGSPYPPVIYSSLVRDDRQIEERQAKAGNFELAIRYNKSLKNQMEFEKKRHLERCKDQLSQRRQLLETRLNQERKDVEDACDRMRLAFENRFALAAQRQNQSIKNLTHDNEHALMMEFCAPREVRHSLTQARNQPKSYQSRPKTSSTFMGRTLMEKAGMGSMDVPSVCKMEARDGQGVLVDADGQSRPLQWNPIQDSPRFVAQEKTHKRPNTASH